MERREQKARQILEAALENQVAAGCPGVILDINAPRLGFTFSAARGLFDRQDSRALQTGDAFRAASVTKAVTAALAVSLAAQERWGLDNPVADYLPHRITEKLGELRGLQTVKELTLRRLLNQTSGLPDYFFAPSFQARVQADPIRLWEPETLIEAAVASGPLLFPPGTGFAYGDTAYVVVGVAIEHLLNRSLAEAYRSVIFDPLGMDSTYLEWREPSRGSTFSHHYEGEDDLWGKNLSFDWAGGGLVTTAGDLTRFLRGLFDGVLFSRSWLSEMTKWQPRTRWRPKSSARYLKYGLGLGANMAYGEELIGVTGVWGAFGYYWPMGETTITGTVNLVGADRPALMDEVIRALITIQPATENPGTPE